MAASEALIKAIDLVIEYFNSRRMDLPDGLFDRRTQFVINGAPFETLLGQPPNDALVLMLTRGPAGFRFTSKTLQHAVPDAKLARLSTQVNLALPDPLSLRTTGPSIVVMDLRLSGTLRGTGESLNSSITVTMRLADAGHVAVAEATVDADDLEKIRAARIVP